jgi:transmembrane sensor
VSEMRPDAPPLSDLSRQRIRQAVFERLDREAVRLAPAPPVRRNRRVVALVAVSAAVAALIAVAAVNGLGGERREVAAPQPSPSRLETGATPSEVTVGDARITAGPHAALTVNEAGSGGVQIFIERGSIEFAVAPRGERPPFVVFAADVRVEVVGTLFTVARDGDDVSVTVAKGVVRVTRAGEPVAHVAAGQSWPPSAGEPPASEPELTFEPEPATAARAKRKKEAPPPPPDEQRNTAPTPRERYEAAAAAESSRPEAALAGYRALAADGGAWADNALFAQASLELKLGRTAAARRSLTAYLARYPRGANAALARTLLDGLP